MQSGDVGGAVAHSARVGQIAAPDLGSCVRRRDCLTFTMDISLSSLVPFSRFLFRTFLMGLQLVQRVWDSTT